MAKYKPRNYDQVAMLPISLENQLVPGSLEQTINQLVEQKVDLSVFDQRHNNNNDDSRAAAIPPKVLLNVILFGYSRGMLSSRQIERACLENITFMALACGHTPDHSAIAAFVSSMQDEVERVFCDVLVVCQERGLLGGSRFSLDGVKLSANVSKEWSGMLEELKRKRDKLQKKVKQVVVEHAQADENPEFEKEQQKKREKRLQQQVDRLNAFLASAKPKMGRDGREIQSNAVDNESVKMPTLHGVVQGYNAQALVDAKHQVILAAETFSTQDHDNLEPMLTGAKKNLNDEKFFQGKELTADSNYHSCDSLTFCRTAGVDAYIPDIRFRKRDERFVNQARFKDGFHDAAPKKDASFSAEDDSPRSKKNYARRLGKVEPVFANICVHKRINRPALRSKSKVDVQWRLFALVHNIGKICVFGALKQPPGSKISLPGPGFAPPTGPADGWLVVQPPAKGFFNSFVSRHLAKHREKHERSQRVLCRCY